MEDRPDEIEPETKPAGARPSLAERLMNPPSNAPARTSRPESADSTPASSRGGDVGTADRARNTASLRGAFASARFREDPALRAAIKEARRFVRIRYFGFLAALVLLLATLVIAACVLIASLLTDANWEQIAVSAGVAAGALVLLLLLQYRPVEGFASASVDITRLEAIGSHIERSYALWDEFLEQRADANGLAPEDVALAVSSMTSAVKETVAIQAAVLDARRQSNAGRPANTFPPTPTVPDPRRY